MAIVSAQLLMLYVSTFEEGRDVLLTAIVLLITGLTMAFITVGFRVEPFNLKTFSTTLMWTLLSFVAMYIVNIYAPFHIELAFFTEQHFAILMGIVEEVFFRMFLCGFIDRFLKNSLIAIGASSFAWSIYHINRYGASLYVLGIVFLCGCVLGASFLYSRQPDGCIIAHGGINYLATRA